MKNSRILIWIIAALCIIAIGYVGVEVYRQVQDQKTLQLPAPTLPLAPH